MKKGIYLTIITIITVICIIGGSLYHLVNFLSFLPFHTTTSLNCKPRCSFVNRDATL